MNGTDKKILPTDGKRQDNCCISDLAIDCVTVYLDKAEVTRSTKYELLEGQVLECCFEQLPSSIDKDSIRVEVQGHQTSIQDVTYNTRPTGSNIEYSEQLKKVAEQIKVENQMIESLEFRKMRFTKQKSVLDSFATTLISSTADEDHGKTAENDKARPNAYDPKHLETVKNFFQLYNESGEKFDEGILEIDHSIEECRSKIAALEAETKEINLRQDEKLFRELLVLIESKADTECQLTISYVVKNCSWRPVYDVRVSNQTGSMQICYYGIVKQSSGEDWYQAVNFNLSSSEPGTGGTVPEIGIQRVQFKTAKEHNYDVISLQPITQVVSSPNMKKSPSRLSSFRKSKALSSNAFDFSTLTTNPVALVDLDDTKNIQETTKLNSKEVSKLSVSYEIARPPGLVTCDSTECRVMIAVVNLDPIYQHITIPKLSQYAYLRTVCRNSSEYSFLAGPANIYVDSSFIGKTSLSTTCPCEDFICNLGADRGIDVEYRPMIKFRESKGKNVIVTFRQDICIMNNHSRPIKILVLDQFPESLDEKIKISLVEPQIKNIEKYDKTKPVRINSNCQIEWEYEIGSKDKKEMTLKFNVEHPVGKDIEVLNIKQQTQG